MLLALLPLAAVSQLQVSHTNVRLPFRLDGSSPGPTTTIEIDKPNARCRSLDKSVVTVNATKGRNGNTLCHLFIEATQQEPVSAEVEVLWQDETLSVPVYVSTIEAIEIKTITRNLYMMSINNFKVEAKDDIGNVFTGLGGLDVQWSFENESMFTVMSVDATPFKQRYADGLPPDHIIVKPIEQGTSKLRAALPQWKRRCEVELKVSRAIVFSPKEYLLMKGAETKLRLYNAQLGASNQILSVVRPEDEIFVAEQRDLEMTVEKPGIAKVDNYGKVTALELGESKVQVKNTVVTGYQAQAMVKVVPPTEGKWDEQWIKVNDGLPDSPAGPYSPVTDTIVVTSKNRPIVMPAHINWALSDEWKEVGTHLVAATLNEYPMLKILGKVHTCRRPYFVQESVSIPLGHNGYETVLKEGSGFFKYIVTDPSVCELKGTKIYTKGVGETTIVAEDQKLPGFKAVMKVIVAELHNIDFRVTQNELYIGDKVHYDFTATYINAAGSVMSFDYVETSGVVVGDPSIIGHDLVGRKQGFTTVKFTIAEKESDVIHMNVFPRLQVQSPIQGTSRRRLPLNRKGGPVKWNDGSGQNSEITCEGTKVTVHPNDYLEFHEDYDGECTIVVQNEKTATNPNPIRAEATFKVINRAIARLALVVHDPSSINDCNFVSRVADIEEVIDHILIPQRHTLVGKLYAYGTDDKNLGEYTSPSCLVRLRTASGQEEDFNGSVLVSEDFVITVHEDGLPDFVLHVASVPPHGLKGGDDMIVLYEKEKSATHKEIIGGSGNFTIRGDLAEIDDRTIKIMPLSEHDMRTITIIDRCIPENSINLSVTTESAASLTIIGPTVGVVGQTLEFETVLTSPSGQHISEKSFRLVTWTHKPEILKTDDNVHWTMVALEPGRYDLEITADDIMATHTVKIFDRMTFEDELIYMYVNEKRILHVVGGPDNPKDVEYVSNDTNIVRIEEGTLMVATHPGFAEITAHVPINPAIIPAKLRVRVLEARALLLEVSTQTPYVDSYVHIVAKIETDIGIRDATTVAWEVDGNNQWEKLYDSSLMVKGANEGFVIVTASTQQQLTNATKIYFDYKLNVLTPRNILLPVGTRYAITVEDNLPVSVTSTGPAIRLDGQTIHAEQEGESVVIVRYKQQWTVIAVTVSKPNLLYLNSLAAATVKPRLLDTDGQEYSTKNGTDIEFDHNYNSVVAVDEYSFEIPEYLTTPEKITCTVSVPDQFKLSHSALLFPQKLIHPQHPTIQRGASVEFKCYAKQQNWYSMNQRVASVSDSGVVTALKAGRSIIRCTDEIETPVTVVDFEEVNLDYVEPGRYRIRPQFSLHEINSDTMKYVEDLMYTCSWQAEECGSVAHEFVNGTHYCQLTYFEHRLCPEHSLLEVTAESANAGLNLKGTYEIVHVPSPFGVRPEFSISVSNRHPENQVIVDPLPDEILYQVSPGLRMNMTKSDDDRTVVKIIAAPSFTKGTVILEHKPTGERVRIHVVRDRWIWTTNELRTFKKLTAPMLFLSVIVTLGAGLYFAYLMGGRNLLPLNSPYAK